MVSERSFDTLITVSEMLKGYIFVADGFPVKLTQSLKQFPFGPPCTRIVIRALILFPVTLNCVGAAGEQSFIVAYPCFT
jgi:hypothetical protein